MISLDDIGRRLERWQKNGSGYKARCPAHDDSQPSLSVSTGDDGRILLKCHAGCRADDICKAIGIQMSDLFPDRQQQRQGFTLSMLAAHKRLPEAHLKSLGLYDLPEGGVGIPYRNASGTTHATKRRLHLVAKQGSRWPKDTALIAYGNERISDARELEMLVLVEGESDCWTLWYHGFPALGLPGADTVKRTLRAEHVEGIKNIYYVREPDKGGETFEAAVPERLKELGWNGELLKLELKDSKDPSDLHIKDPTAFKATFASLLEAAKTLSAPTESLVSIAWRDRITPISTEWCTEAPPVRRWLLRDGRRPSQDGMLPRGKAGQLIAEGGAGKTMALVQLADAIATGRMWFDSFYVERPGRVFLLLAEEDAEEARRRVYNAMPRGIEGPPPPGSIVIAPLCGVPCALLDRDGDGRAVETPFCQDLRKYLVENGPWDLIAFDPLSRLGGPDCETDNAVATRFVQVIESIVEQTGATALVAHHTNKASRNGGPVTGAASRGASALHDGFRWQASLTVERTDSGDIVTFEMTKSNYSRKADQIMLRRSDDGGRLVPLTDKERTEATATLTGEAARRERAQQREQEYESTRAKREEREAAKRAEREQRLAAQTAHEKMLEERALVKILRKETGISTDRLRSALAAALDGCTRDRMRDIIMRLGPAVVNYWPEGSPVNARAYRLEEAHLPEGLR